MSTQIIPKFVDEFRVAEILSTSPRRVLQWAKAGKIPSIALPDGSFVFDADVLTKWIDARRQNEAMATT